MGASKTKKHQVAIWVTDSTDLKNITGLLRIAKSTANTITANATTNSYDYIDQEKPETELDSYAYSMEHDIAMYKGNPDYEWAFEKFFYGDTGESSKGTVLVVFFDHEAPAGVYKAFASNATFSVSSMDAVTGVVNMSIAFNGDPVYGSVTGNGVPVFVEAPAKPSAIIDESNVVTMASNTEGAEVRYTTDGTNPVTDGTPYTTGITIAADTVFKIVAVKDGVSASRIITVAAKYNAPAVPDPTPADPADPTGEGA